MVDVHSTAKIRIVRVTLKGDSSFNEVYNMQNSSIWGVVNQFCTRNSHVLKNYHKLEEKGNHFDIETFDKKKFHFVIEEPSNLF